MQVDDHHGGFTSQDVVVTVTGTNDAPTVTASNGAFTELAGTGNAALDHAGGSITFADLDLSDRPDVSASFTGYTYKAANGITGLSLTAQQATRPWGRADTDAAPAAIPTRFGELVL